LIWLDAYFLQLQSCFCCGCASKRDRENSLGGDPISYDQVFNPSGQTRRFPCAGSSDNPERATTMPNNLALLVG
jgi:hypothetical protein